jgi:hypothetical protein
VLAELALFRKAGAGGHLCQGEVAALLQELPGPLDAASDDVWCGGSPVARLNCRAK